VDCIDLAQDTLNWRAVVHTVMIIRFPENARDVLNSFLRRTLFRAVCSLVITS
jgi:hypothetical protein